MTIEQQQSITMLHRHLQNCSERPDGRMFLRYIQGLQALIREHDDNVRTLASLRDDLRLAANCTSAAFAAVSGVHVDADVVCKAHSDETHGKAPSLRLNDDKPESMLDMVCGMLGVESGTLSRERAREIMFAVQCLLDDAVSR